MTNAQVSLSPLLNLDGFPIEPFVVGGIGLAINGTDSMEYRFDNLSALNIRFSPSGRHIDFAWSVGAGFEYNLTDDIGLQFLYRYSDLGKVVTDVGNYVMTTDNTFGSEILIDKTEAPLQTNEFLISLTYRY